MNKSKKHSWQHCICFVFGKILRSFLTRCQEHSHFSTRWMRTPITLRDGEFSKCYILVMPRFKLDGVFPSEVLLLFFFLCSPTKCNQKTPSRKQETKYFQTSPFLTWRFFFWPEHCSQRKHACTGQWFGASSFGETSFFVFVLTCRANTQTTGSLDGKDIKLSILFGGWLCGDTKWCSKVAQFACGQALSTQMGFFFVRANTKCFAWQRVVSRFCGPIVGKSHTLEMYYQLGNGVVYVSCHL